MVKFQPSLINLKCHNFPFTVAVFHYFLSPSQRLDGAESRNQELSQSIATGKNPRYHKQLNQIDS